MNTPVVNNFICGKVAKALHDYLHAQTISFSPTIVRGQSTDEKRLPLVICQCSAADHQPPPMTGNWIATAVVSVRENADDTTEDDHLSHAGEVFNLLMTTTIAADMTAAATLFNAYLVVAQSSGYDLVDRSWQSWLQLSIHCCGS